MRAFIYLMYLRYNTVKMFYNINFKLFDEKSNKHPSW